MTKFTNAVAFNWKEKMELRLEKKNARVSEARMKDWGYLEELQGIGQGNKTSVPFPNKEKDGFIVPTNKASGNSNDENNGRTIINMRSLFGSNKPYGILPSRAHKQRYSKKRVFDSKIGVAKSNIKNKLRNEVSL